MAPDAKRCRRAVNGEIVAKAETGTIGTGETGPVIFQLDGLMTEADDVGIFLGGIGYDRTLYNAALIIRVCCNSISSHSIKVMNCRADGGIIPRVLIAAVEDHGRLHADIHGNCGAQVAARGGDGRAAGVFHVARDGEPVVRKRTCIRVGDGPVDVAVLEMDLLGLIGRPEAKVADVVIVEVDFTRRERKGVRLLHMQDGRTDRLAAAD